MNLIFIHIGTKKIDYLSHSIQQVLFFNKRIRIFLVSNKKTFNRINNKIKKKIIFENIEELKISNNHRNFIKNSLLDKEWYQGFWTYTTERFFYLENLALKYKLKNIIHIENDILLYFDLFKKKKVFEKFNIGILLDSNIKAIPSFLYFKNLKYLSLFVKFIFKSHSMSNMILGKTFGKITQKLNNKNKFIKNDMDLLFEFYSKYKKTKIINILPSSTPYLDKNSQYSKNIDIEKYYKEFEGIFDPANYGLYLDGFDRNKIFKKKFINKDLFISKSAINLKNSMIKFENINNLNMPFLKCKNKHIKLLSLHIHSKQLNKFLSK